MTKKDYILIAEALKDANQEAIDNAPQEFLTWYRDMYRMVVDSLAECLSEDNARFNKVKFREATDWSSYGT